ncbi:MAG: CsgG/HfaB family protein [Planctomycetaceae bacterium]
MRSLRVQTGLFACCLTAASIGLLSGCGNSEPSTTNTATEASLAPAPVAPASRETDPASAIAPATLPENNSAAAKDETENESLAHDAVAAVRPPQADIYLSRLTEESVEFWEYKPNWGFNTNGFIGLRDETNPENKIVLGGIPSPHGIFAHPPPNGQSSVKYQIGDFGYSTFSSTVGVADVRQYGPSTPLSFEIYGDGKELWKSKPVDRWGIPQETGPVDIAGVQQLELRVICPGDGGFAFAVWCESRLIHSPPPSPLEGDGPITLAVLRFEDQGTSVEFNRLGAAVAEMLAHDLREYRKLRILERTAAGNLIEERDLAEANIVNGDAAGAAKLTAQYLVTGICNASAGKLTVTARLTKVGDDKPLQSLKQTGTVDDLKKFEAVIVKHFVKALKASESYGPKRTPAEGDATPTLAVLPLKNNSPNAELDVMQEGFADILQSSLGAMEEVTLVDRREIENILNEQKLSLSGLVDLGTAVQVGQLLKADLLLVGSFLQTETDLEIQVRLVDAQSSSIVASEQVSGTRDNFAELLEDLTLKVLSDLSLEPTDAAKDLVQAAFPARSMEAAVHMATAQRLLAEGRQLQAVEAYQKVTLLEPGNILCYRRQMSVLWLQGKFSELEQAGNRAQARPELSQAPWEHRAEILWLMAHNYSSQNRYPELVEVTDRIVAEFPAAQGRANHLRGGVLLRLNRWDEGLKLMESASPGEADPENDWKDAGLKDLFLFYVFYSDDYSAPASIRTPAKRAEMCNKAIKIFDRILVSADGKRDRFASEWSDILIPNGVDHLRTYDDEGYIRNFLTPAEKVDMMQRALNVFDWKPRARATGTFSLATNAEDAEMWDVAIGAYREYLKTRSELEQSVGSRIEMIPSSFDFQSLQPNSWIDEKIEAYYRLARITHEGLRQTDEAVLAYQEMVREVGLVNFHGADAVVAMNKLGIKPEYPEKCALVWGWDSSGQRSWERVLGPAGYKVHSLRTNVLTLAKLSPYSLVILARPGIKTYTPTEMLALRSYVAAGGSLFIIVSPGWEPGAPSIHRGLLSFFNMDVGEPLPTRTKASRLGPHAITEGITEATAKSAVAIKAPVESTVIAAGDDGLLAAAEYRFGRVVVSSFGQWFIPEPAIFADGWQNHRSGHWTTQISPADLPFEEGAGLCRPLLENVVSWLEECPERSSEFRKWKSDLAEAHWTAWKVHAQVFKWSEMAAPFERLIESAPDEVTREESLWIAGESSLNLTCFAENQHLMWPTYSLKIGAVHDPESRHYRRLMELYPDSDLFHYAAWRFAECERIQTMYRVAAGHRNWDRAGIRDAMSLYGKASAPQGTHPWAWSRLMQATLLINVNDMEAATKPLKEIIEIMPHGPERTMALSVYGDTLSRSKQNSEARRIYEELNSLPLMGWNVIGGDWLTMWYPVTNGMESSHQAAYAGKSALEQQK